MLTNINTHTQETAMLVTKISNQGTSFSRIFLFTEVNTYLITSYLVKSGLSFVESQLFTMRVCRTFPQKEND